MLTSRVRELFKQYKLQSVRPVQKSEFFFVNNISNKGKEICLAFSPLYKLSVDVLLTADWLVEILTVS